MERRGFLRGASSVVGASLLSGSWSAAQSAGGPSVPPMGMTNLGGGAPTDEAFWTQIRQQFRLSIAQRSETEVQSRGDQTDQYSDGQ